MKATEYRINQSNDETARNDARYLYHIYDVVEESDAPVANWWFMGLTKDEQKEQIREWIKDGMDEICIDAEGDCICPKWNDAFGMCYRFNKYITIYMYDFDEDVLNSDDFDINDYTCDNRVMVIERYED